MSTFNRAARMTRLIAVCGLVVVIGGTRGAMPTRAQEATPRAAPPPGSLAAMLQLSPDVSSGTEEAPLQLATYGDLAAQSAISGVPVPSSSNDPDPAPWFSALSAILIPDPFFQYAFNADWRSLVGFDLWEIDQALQSGEPPEVFTLLRGRFDEASIRAAWAAQGYKMLDVDGVPVASLNEDARVDIDTDLGRIAAARFNNAAILPDGTLAFSPTLEGMRSIIAVAQGRAPSLGDRDHIAALVGAIQEPLASAILVNGAELRGELILGRSLEATPVSDVLQTMVAEFHKMPPIEMALLGVTLGGPISLPNNQLATPQPDISPAQFEIALLLSTQEEAETAAGVAENRLATMSSLATGRPLTDYFASWDTHVLPDRPVAVLVLDFAQGVLPRLWLDMFNRRDWPFLAW